MRDLKAETAAWELLERLRWDGPPVCPRCGATRRAYFLRPSDGVRRTRSGATTPRRVWKCGACRRQFTVLTGTVWEGTRIALTTWIAALQAHLDVTGTGGLPTTFAPAPMRRHLDHVLRAVTDMSTPPADGDCSG